MSVYNKKQGVTKEDFYYKILVKTCLVDLQGNAHLRIF